MAVATCAIAQPERRLAPADVNALALRMLQLMESTAIAVPELVRTSTPVLENVRQARANLIRGPGHSGFTLDMLTHSRAYLVLADAMPKPYPFPEEARRQFAELRDASARLEAHFRALLERKEADLRSPDPNQTSRYREENQRVGASRPEVPRVIFMGDSITDRWRLNEYFPGRDFLNRGIEGQTTTQMLARFKADVLDLKPAAVVILGGANDLVRGIPIVEIADNIEMMAELARSRGIKVIVASVLAVSDHHRAVDPNWERTPARPLEKIRALNEVLRASAARNGHAWVDYHSPSAGPDGQLKAELADDGLHPNAQGYRLMAPLVLEAIDRVAPPVVPKGKKRK
ncbi:MAG: SGNH/GDSL hydrolase family protein [Bryobacteraceae bacterium]|nr:SGNH/GDSL hydrolase family protein [Bryobacteraceae bacterium]